MTNLNDPDDPADVVVIELPDVHVYTEDDDLPLPTTDQTGEHTGGLGAL